MKKLVLAAAVLLGGIAASQAGVSVHIGFGNPFPRPVVISRPAPVWRAPVVVAPPVCRDQFVRPAPVVVVPHYRPSYPRYGYNDYRDYRHGSHRDWDRHGRGDDRRDDHRNDRGNGHNHGRDHRR